MACQGCAQQACGLRVRPAFVFLRLGEAPSNRPQGRKFFMMTKLEIYESEQSNPGVVYLYPEGMFYKAYEKSAYLLCTRVHAFKVSCRPMKGWKQPLLSVGFPMSSLEKFSAGMVVQSNSLIGGVQILVPSADFSGFDLWKAEQSIPLQDALPKKNEAPFNSLPVYGLAWRLTVELTTLAARLDRNYRYSLGEDLRKGGKQAVLCIMLAGKGEEKSFNIHQARLAAMDVQLTLRLLNELKVIPDARYVDFVELTENITKQLSNWERKEISCRAGIPSPRSSG